LPDAAAWLAKQSQGQDSNIHAPALLRFLAFQPSARKAKLTAETLFAVISVMPFLLLLDGFDEVGAAEDRDRIVTVTREMLTELGRKGARAVIVATTRPQGYAGELSRLGVLLTTKYLAQLTPEDALTYAKKLVEAKIQGADEQEKTLDRLRAAARETATSRLLRTPLQVTIMAALVQQGRAPSERWKLFWSYFDFTYRREIDRDTYASELLAARRSHIEAIHQRVALLLQVEAENAGGAAARMARDRLQSIVDAVLQEDEIDDKKRADLVQSIVDAAEKRLVFLVEPEPGSFGFEIRSLQEFMAAWALAEGRDSAVEARILQVAKAPLFRNVVLFLTSKFFSERSALRDTLADRICGTLDDDPSDALARITKVAALLALDVLEEGSALTQPKRARALMRRAVGLLDLPPAKEHARLARVATDDTAPVLRSALEMYLAPGGTKQVANKLAAWICLIEAINVGEAWARQVAEVAWPLLKDPADIVDALWSAEIPLGRWIISKIEANPEAFPPERILSLSIRMRREPEPAVESWVNALTRFYSSMRGYSVLSGNVLFISMRSLSNSHLSIFNIPSDVPSSSPSWRAWIAAAKFDGAPSATSLAKALYVIAEALPRDKWCQLVRRMPWPISACLNVAETSAELRHFADTLSRGELGDSADWYLAEQHWPTGISIRAILDALVDGLPWTLQSLRSGPPLAALRITHIPTASLKEASSVLQQAARAFQASRSSILRQRLANICLLLLQHLPPSAKPDMKEVGDWYKAAQESTREAAQEGFFVPIRRPRCITIEQWVGLLETLGQRRTLVFMHDALDAVNAYVKNSDSPGLLYLVMSAFSQERPSSLSPEVRARLKDEIRNQSYEDQQTRADAAVLKVWLGSVTDIDVRDLLREIFIQAKSERFIGYWFLAAIENGELPDTLREPILMQSYAELGTLPELAATAIGVMRTFLQSRRSGLGVPATWEHLELPPPYPLISAAIPPRTMLPEKPVVLRNLHLEHIRGLTDLKLLFESPQLDQGQWIVFLGPNGAGKTTLLRSLALALRNLHDPKIWPKGTFATPWKENEESGEAKISVQLADYGEHTTHVRSNGSEAFFQNPKQEAPRLFPLFAYGCRRGSALGGAAREVDLGDDDGPEVATLFDEGAPLIHAETWLIQWDGDAQKSRRSRVIFEAVRAALTALLSVKSIEVRSQKVWVSERGGPAVPFKALSDGYITTAGWFLDLIARWIQLAERCGVPVDANFMERMTGLVLLDEIDLHLHPRWQIEVIDRTRRLLPKMSFVVTTHNPLTLVGAKPEEIWILSLDGDRVRASRGVETPMLLTGGQIYSRYFGIDDIHPHELGRKLRRYGFLSGYALRDDAEQAEMEKLRAELRQGGVDPGWEEVPREPLPEIKPAAKTKKPAAKKPAAKKAKARGKEA
jgi:ABC-type multidrug transport system fused ATPase/permease subunit